MAGRTIHYGELTASELATLDPAHTIVLMALSPLEVHGPHLPLACDVVIAEEVQRRLLSRLAERYPEYDRLLLPPAYAGADTNPVPGSVSVDSRAIYYLLLSTGRSLARQGFRYLLVTDNHGGPRHQIAIEKAVRRVYTESRFTIIAPFLNFYRRTVENDPALLAATGTGPGSSGDLSDAHAGRNETSLMLATAPEKVAPAWRSLPPVTVGQGAVARGLVRVGSAALRLLGARRLAADLPALGMALGWLAAGARVTYVGEPRMASAEAGERMLEAHVQEALAQLDRALAGRPPYSRPVLWSLRWVERS